MRTTHAMRMHALTPPSTHALEMVHSCHSRTSHRLEARGRAASTARLANTPRHVDHAYLGLLYPRSVL
jgi:hypothetical protein